MHRFESIDLGAYRGDDYFLTGFVTPEPWDDFVPDEDATEYGVSIARSSDCAFEDNVEIVRMDTAHGQPHLDKVYLPSDANEARKHWLEEDYTYDRMKGYFLANWQHFVDLSSRYDE